MEALASAKLSIDADQMVIRRYVSGYETNLEHKGWVMPFSAVRAEERRRSAMRKAKALRQSKDE